ncbi:MAG: YfcE family phosphodiesterase [Acetanaerobacterium sp.]
MRIIVISDTHRNYRVLREIVQKHEHEAKMFLFAGDGERELDHIKAEYEGAVFCAVRGNCDFASMEKASRVVIADGVRIFLTHGDRYGVKSGTGRLLAAARENGAKIAVFGHTHVAHCVYEEGIHLLNPGSAASPRSGRPSYGVVDITPNGIVPFIVEL